MEAMVEEGALEIRLESPELELTTLAVRRLTAHESIGETFSFDLQLVQLTGVAVSSQDLLGIDVTIVFSQNGFELRRVGGIVSRVLDRADAAGAFAGAAHHRTYSVTVVPKLFRMALVKTQEVYLDLSLPEIIKKKAELYGFAHEDIDLRLAEEHPAREFVVQYRETDVAFLSRLCEHVGVSFFFVNEGGKDKVVFTDNEAGFAIKEEAERLPYRSGGEKDGVFELATHRELVPSFFAMQDYDYRNPLYDLGASASLDLGSGGGYVEYGAHYRTADEGQRLAQVRADEQRARAHRYFGKSDHVGLSAGARIVVEGHPELGDIELVVVEVAHTASAAESGEGGEYENRFVAVPAGFTYRPERKTPRPRIHGFVTGVVQAGQGGAVGGVAHVDGDGRYLVELHFDAAPKGEARASRPIRMAQPYAGPNHGMHFPLRPGAEVLLAFMDGDPDRPVIIGAVPNATAPSPVNASSANKNRIVTGNGGIIIEMCDGR